MIPKPIHQVHVLMIGNSENQPNENEAEKHGTLHVVLHGHLSSKQSCIVLYIYLYIASVSNHGRFLLSEIPTIQLLHL